MPITKHNFIVKDVTKLADTIRKSIYDCTEGSPGPVLVDIHKGCNSSKTEFISRQNQRLIQKQFEDIDEEDLESASDDRRIAKTIYICRRRCIISGAEQELKEFVEKVDAPVTAIP